jgi:hypothetical protein
MKREFKLVSIVNLIISVLVIFANITYDSGFNAGVLGIIILSIAALNLILGMAVLLLSIFVSGYLQYGYAMLLIAAILLACGFTLCSIEAI